MAIEDVYNDGVTEHFVQSQHDKMFQGKYATPGKPIFKQDESGKTTIFLYYTPNEYIYNTARLRTTIDLIHSYIKPPKKSPISFTIKSQEHPLLTYEVNIDLESEKPIICFSVGQNKIYFDGNGNITQYELMVGNSLATLTNYPGTDHPINSNEVKVNKKILCIKEAYNEPKLLEHYKFYVPQQAPSDASSPISDNIKQSLTALANTNSSFTLPTGKNPIENQKVGISSIDSILQICSINKEDAIETDVFERTGTYEYYFQKAQIILSEMPITFVTLVSAATTLANSNGKAKTVDVLNDAYKRIINQSDPLHGQAVSDIEHV